MFTPDTEVRLLNHIPLTPQYEHQMDFPNVGAQSTYFTGKTSHVFTDFTYVREDSTLKVPRGRDSLYTCNYLMFRNKQFSGKWFYGFITKLEYVNPNTTKIYFEIDVYQTWQFDFTFKPSFVAREHQARWKANGHPNINTLDEGLDYGSEYETVSIENFTPYGDIFFLVMVTKSAMHYAGGTSFVNKIKPNLNGLPQPLTYYIHPFRLDGTSPTIQVGGTPATISPILEALESLFTQKSAVENVVSLYVTEYFDNIAYTKSNDTLSFDGTSFEVVSVSDDSALNMNTLHVKKLEFYRSNVHSFGDKYKGFTKPSESKLMMYPYTVTILDDLKGNRIELKNEYINSEALTLRFKGSLGTSNKVSYQVDGYTLGEPVLADQNAGMEHALINNNPNDLPILAELLSAYLQGNRNQLENQKNAILFNTISSALTGAIGGAIGGGKLGVMGAIGGAGIGAMNSYYKIEGMNAKQQDISNTPPSMSKMGGNTAYDFGNQLSGVYVIKKQITAEYRKKLEDYFKMYGYKVNEVKVPNLKTRAHFNYVQTVGANITGNIPQDDLTKLKSLFDSGITLWHVQDVGNYALLNGEI